MIRLEDNTFPQERLIRIPADLGGGTVITARPLNTTTGSRPVLSEPALVKEPVNQTLNVTKTFRTVTVLDETGNPLPGAHVYFTATRGETTDYNGKATVSSSNVSEAVTVSYMGFVSQKFPLNALPSVVRLNPDNQLGEVIVTAPAKAAKTDSKVPKYLFPAIGGIALLLILMSAGSPTPKEVTL